MASVYTNNLRLEEIGTGEQSGTWGDTTNTNLILIGQAVAWGTRAIANASTDNITITDGALDADRCLGLKLTGGGQACTVTLLPNTSSKTWFMYNFTSYTLTFTCGSGANVAILAGQTKVIATDGLGSGGVVHDLLTAVNLAGVTVVDDLTVSDDLTITGDIKTASNATLDLAPAGTGTVVVRGNTNSGAVVFNCESNTHGQKVFGQPHSASVTNTLMLPAGNNSTLVSRVSVDTLTNKTLAAPVVNGGAVFNEDSADVDFRVESNGNANMVFVDGGNNKVAIGTATATAMLTVAGSLKPISYEETYVALTAGSTVTLNLAAATNFSLTMAQGTTFAFSNPPGSGTAYSFTLMVTQHSSAVTITWPSSVDWAGGSAPAAAGNNEVQAYAFLTRDGGTTYYGFLGGTAIG